MASTLQAAHQLKLFVIGSHGLAKGALATHCADAVREAMPEIANDAQRALQFNRSTPGLAVSLVGISTLRHLEDLLAVAARAPLPREAYPRLYRRAGA